MTRSLTPTRVHKLPTREEGTSLREGKSEIPEKKEHVSVMVDEVLSVLAPVSGDIVVDGTAGSGGHSEAILNSAKNISLIAVDADPDAVARTRERLSKLAGGAKDVQVVEGNFGDLDSILKHHHGKEVTKVLLDLGWNMEQLSSGRGFSFMHDEPLDMRYGVKAASGFTAAEVLNTWEEKAIADALFGYGEERYARRIARATVERREIEPIATTLEFVEIIRDAVPASYRHGRINPATRSFQALRIAVNDELGVIERGIQGAWKHLTPGGRIAVITFHSIEDRVVKRIFAELVKKGEGKLLSKKPLTATEKEISHNRPSRSAKLRSIEKI